MHSEPLPLGMRIRRARERARLSQEDLAKAVGASVRAVGDWENDRRKPRNRLGALEEVLGVSLHDDPDQRPSLSPTLLREIMTTEGLTLEQRQALISDIEEMLARERGYTGGAGEAGPSGEAHGSDGPHRHRRRPAS